LDEFKISKNKVAKRKLVPLLTGESKEEKLI